MIEFIRRLSDQNNKIQSEVSKRIGIFKDMSGVMKSLGLMSGTIDGYLQNPDQGFKPALRPKLVLIVSWLLVLRYFLLALPFQQRIAEPLGQLEFTSAKYVTISALMWCIYVALLVHLFHWGMKTRKLGWLEILQVSLLKTEEVRYKT